ncbi:MAG: hypothetical protein BroJett021_34240 [Chloroflexota bacterium]|nr:MAG: hypothetical protein BroJett021_34240 [Chloroflexota bacterium]
MATSLEEWNALWKGIREINDLFPDGMVFIGGVAVYLHINKDALPPGFIEFSHDADLYFSLADFSDLRDMEEVTANRRLNKHQIIKHGVEYDIYLERHNSLAIPYSEAFAHSVVIDNIRAACLEHLLVLKLDAFSSRKGSSKGAKDERDLIRICYLLAGKGIDMDLVAPYLDSDRMGLLKGLKNSPGYLVLCEGNAHKAKPIRDAVNEVIKMITGQKLQKASKP